MYDERGWWKLDGLTLTLTLPSQSAQLTIIDADANRVVTQNEHGGIVPNRRCTAADRRDAEAASTTTEGMDSMTDDPEMQADKLPDLTQGQ